MKAEDCFQLGYITKVHGISGELQVNFEADEPENYIEMESVFVEINRKLIPFFIEDLNLSGKKGILKFEDVDSIEEAEEFVGKKLFLSLEALPELNQDQFYYHQIIGFAVIDAQLGQLGTVKEVMENPGHDLVNMEYQSKEILIPVTDHIILKADLPNKILQVNLPDGLLDIYLEDSKDEVSDEDLTEE